MYYTPRITRQAHGNEVWEAGRNKGRGKKKPVAGTYSQPRALEKCWLPICNRLRTRPGWVEPEIYFRIVHLAEIGQSCAPVAPYGQAVEVALGPKGAFENGNIGALTRRVSANDVVSTAPAPRGQPKPPKVLRNSRVVELLRKATGGSASSTLARSDPRPISQIGRKSPGPG